MKSLSYLLIIVFVAFSGTSVSAYECQDNMESWNSPCEVVTPVLSAACDALVLNINNTNMNYTTNISAIGDGTYNFTFDYTDVATYSITLDCDNWAGTINLNMGTEEDEPGFNLWVVISLIFAGMLGTGVVYRNYILIFMAGLYPLLMSIWMFQEGITIYGVDNWFIYPLAWIFLGIGLILILLSSLKLLDISENGDDDEDW